jgi:galacturan 1,4-alpha-galacturonidase
MWTMTIIKAANILLEDIYVNSTDTEHAVDFGFSSLNTDGCDTVYADNITFRRWTVDNGDDSISLKANSTNILIEDCEFYTGLGVAIGSIGQYGKFAKSPFYLRLSISDNLCRRSFRDC